MVIAVHNHVDVGGAVLAAPFKRALEGRVIIGGGTYHINQIRCGKVVFVGGISVSVSVTIEGQMLFVSTVQPLSFRFLITRWEGQPGSLFLIVMGRVFSGTRGLDHSGGQKILKSPGKKKTREIK